MFLYYIFITLVIYLLIHISIVLQDFKSEIKTETDECEDVDIKHETLPTINLVASVKKEEVSKRWRFFKFKKITLNYSNLLLNKSWVLHRSYIFYYRDTLRMLYWILNFLIKPSLVICITIFPETKSNISVHDNFLREKFVS